MNNNNRVKELKIELQRDKLLDLSNDIWEETGHNFTVHC